MTPIKCPHLLVLNLQNDFYGVVNTWYPNSLRIINSTQLSILNEIDGLSTISRISGKLNIDAELIYQYCKILEEKDIVRFDDKFLTHTTPTDPTHLNLWIHTTNKCNLTCSYCYISTLNSTGGMSEPVQRQLLEKLERTVKDRGLQSVKLRLAGGEPMTQFKAWKPFIEKAYKLFEEIHCDFSVVFLTNLTILNKEIVEFSKDFSIGYGVSIDGIHAYHDQERKFHNNKGSFAVVDTNIDTLLANGISVSTSTVVSNSNLQGLPSLAKYLIEKNILFRFSIVKGEIIDRSSLSSYLQDAYNIMENAIDEGWSFSRYHRFCDLKPSELGFQTCGSGFSGASIYVDGGVYYCHVQFGTKSLQSGTLFDDSQDLVSLINNGKHHEGFRSDDCTNCNYRHVCTSGCPMYRENGKDPNCSLYHEFIPVIYRLQAKERLKLILNKKSGKLS